MSLVATVEQTVVERGDKATIRTVFNRVEPRRIGTAAYFNQYYSRYSRPEDPR